MFYFPRIIAASKNWIAAPTRHLLRHLWFCLRHPKQIFASLGPVGSARFVFLPAIYELKRSVMRNGCRHFFLLTSPRSAVALYCRAGSSDVDAFRQIFVEQEYACLGDLEDPGLMLDCGANVGFSAAWFLSRYPSLQVIAVEPDSDNMKSAQKNLKPFGSRVSFRESGVWSSQARLTIVRDALDGREWAITVRESGDDEAHDLIAIDIPTLVQQSGQRRVSLLKVDVEGAEGRLFGHGNIDWIDSVDNLVIETHGPSLARIVDAAMPAVQFTRSYSGELTCYRRIALARSVGGAENA